MSLEWQPIATLVEEANDDPVAFFQDDGSFAAYEFAQFNGTCWLTATDYFTPDEARYRFTHWARILPPVEYRIRRPL